MDSVASLDPQSSLWALVAYELRRYRKDRGVSLAAAGRVMNVSESHFSNFESGRRRPDLKKLRAIDEAWDTRGHFVRLATFAMQGHDPNWFAEHLEYEARAHALRLHAPLVVPGLFQTEDYARITIGEDSEIGTDIDAAVRGRLARKTVLTGRNPPRVHILLDEGVLDRPVGGPAVMRAQLAYLLEVSEMRNVTMRVRPRSTGYHRGLISEFTVMSVDPEGDIAYTDSTEGGRLVLDGLGVRKFVVRFDEIGADALGRTASRELISRAMEDMR